MIGLSACGGRNLHKELTDDSSVLVRQWTLSTRDASQARRAVEFSHPVLWENTLIFGNQSVGLIAIYPGMQIRRWTLPISGGVISQIVEEKGALYFGGGDGLLYSASAETGRVNWKYDLRNPIISRPTVSGGRVFVTTSDDTVYAFDAGTGKWLWHYRRRTQAPATILGAAAPLVDGKEVLAGLSDGFLVALTLEDGQLRWERKLHQGTKFSDVDSSPVIDNGVVYVASYDGALYALKRQGGEVLWRFDAGASKTVVVDGDRIYLSSTDGNIYCLQKNSAKVLWKFELDRGTPTAIALTEKHLLVGSSFQYFYALDRETGKGAYRLNFGYNSGFYGTPVVDLTNHRAYILSSQGNLISFLVREPAAKIRPRVITQPYEF